MDHEGHTVVKDAVASVRVKTQVGTVQRQLGQVDEAVHSFEAALQLNPEHLMALEGLGETYLAQAHARTSEGLYTAAAAALLAGCSITRKFLDLTIARTSSQGHRGSCAWKLLGDLYTYGHKLPAFCFVTDRSVGKDGEVEDGFGSTTAALRKVSFLFEGARKRLSFVAKGEAPYRRAVEVLGEKQVSDETSEAYSTLLAAALYDLGLNLFLRSQLVRMDAGEGSGPWPQDMYASLPQVGSLASQAKQVFMKALLINPLHSDTWNGLGAVMKDPLVRQHCWVRAVQLAHNASGWANLGMMFVEWRLHSQAYEAFGGLQAVADHPMMWVGLGLLKEEKASQLNEVPQKRRRALDAYFSSLETGQHLDGLTGLGVTASCSQSYESDVLVALQQRVELNPCSAHVWNLLGTALERAGYHRKAIVAYKNAVCLLEDQHTMFLDSNVVGVENEWIDGRNGGVIKCSEALSIIRSNLGRALALCGMANEAVEALQQGDQAQVDFFLQLGRAHAMAGDWDGALAAFSQVEPGSREAAGVLLSEAAMCLKRGEQQEAQKVALKLARVHTQNRLGLIGALCVGALTKDIGILEQVAALLSNLQQNKWNPNGNNRGISVEQALRVTHMATCAMGTQDKINRRALCKAVHVMPTSSQSWAMLGADLADSVADKGAADAAELNLVNMCALASEVQMMSGVLGTMRATGSSGTVKEDGTSAPVFMAGDLSYCLSIKALVDIFKGGRKSLAAAVKTASRAVHECPSSLCAWHSLAAALAGHALASPLPVSTDLRRSRTIFQGLLASPGEDNRDRLALCIYEQYLTLLLEGSISEKTCKSGLMDDVSKPLSNQLEMARCKLAEGGDLEDVVEEFKAAAITQPFSVECWHELSRCYLLLGWPGAALVALKCGVSLVEGSAVAPLYLEMAGIRFRLGQNNEGMMSMGKGSRAGIEGVAVHVLRALGSARLGRKSQALSALEKAKTCDPAAVPKEYPMELFLQEEADCMEDSKGASVRQLSKLTPS
ncbi:unnamed protein product [Discosporangium mesarthrocarpum]